MEIFRSRTRFQIRKDVASNLSFPEYRKDIIFYFRFVIYIKQSLFLYKRQSFKLKNI